MSLTAEDIRLRAPVPEEVYGRLKNKPLLLKGARLAQPALLPGHPLPLVVGFWDDCPAWVRNATLDAMDRWNTKMDNHTSIGSVFQEWPGDPEHVDLMVGTKSFEVPFDPEAEFGSVASGFMGQYTFGRPFGTPNEELGDCQLYWDEDYCVRGGRIFVPDDIRDQLTLSGLLAHELGHALLLGHDPHIPSRLMYRHYGGVLAPRPRECQWVEEIWT